MVSGYLTAKARLRVELVGSEDAPPESITRRVADGLWARLVHKNGSDEAWCVRPRHLEAWGVAADQALADAENATVWDEPAEVRLVVGPHGDRFTWVGGGPWAAGLVLDLGRFLADPSTYGALVVVPTRNAILFHEPAAASVFASALAILRIGEEWHSTDPVSPHLYWWRADLLERVVMAGPAGSEPAWGGEFSAMLSGLEAFEPR